jgi:isocitrate dehydrogenase
VGLAGSANIGESCAMFEAIHGSAPKLAGQNTANPSGLLQGAIQMLNHIGQSAIAERVQNAWLKTLEAGIHTLDIFKEGTSKQLVGTREFGNAVIAHLGQKPEKLTAVKFPVGTTMNLRPYKRREVAKKDLVGVDVFVHWPGLNPNELADKVQKIGDHQVTLSMITNRGIKVWPDGFEETFCTDHWRCRFKSANGHTLSKQQIIQLLSRAEEQGIDSIKTENLYNFNGKQGYSLGQGQ